MPDEQTPGASDEADEKPEEQASAEPDATAGAGDATAPPVGGDEGATTSASAAAETPAGETASGSEAEAGSVAVASGSTEAGASEAGASEAGAREAGALAEEEKIRQELGIGNTKVEINRDEIDRLLGDAVVGYEEIFQDTILDGSALPAVQQQESVPPAPSGEQVMDHNLLLLRDVNMKVKVELGRGLMYLKDILMLGQGSVVELERLAGDPLDIYVNEKVIARGEVLVLNENFCIRITEIYDQTELLTGRA